jgi:hypothetical protein
LEADEERDEPKTIRDLEARTASMPVAVFILAVIAVHDGEAARVIPCEPLFTK